MPSQIFQLFILNVILVMISLYSLDAKKYSILIERVELNAVNHSYIEYWHFHVKRTSRSAPYSLTFNLSLVDPVDNNASVIIKGFEKMNAGYKETPLQMKFTLCDWLMKDKLSVPILKRHAKKYNFQKCPLHGQILVENMIIRSDDAPVGFWPFEKNRLDFDFITTKMKYTIVNFSVFMNVVEVPEKVSSRRG